MKDRTFLHLFFAVLLCELLLLVVSLPGFAGATDISTLVTGGNENPVTILADQLSGATQPSLPAASPLLTETPVITYTTITTPTIASSTFITPSPTSTPTSIPPMMINSVESPQNSFLPIVFQQQITPTPSPTAPPTASPPETVLFCDNLSQPLYIPDNNSIGVSDNIVISDDRVLVSVRLYLDISHTWVGDLVVRLSNQTMGKSITVLNRPGPTPDYCSNNDIVAILDDAAAQPADDKCASYPRAISGTFLPSQSFSIFSGSGVAGTWRLNVSDHFQNDTGSLNHWCLETKLATSMPDPTATPTPVSLPASASISGISGQDQQLNLDCESRSAVDWAKYYGYSIDEIHFLNHLPISDDPEVGFVGNPDGVWGKYPPNDYGIHALPVAALLRDYGLAAQAYRSLRWDDLRASIASGNPAIVWIIGGSYFNLVNGTPHYYTASSTGDLTIVAPYEHTVILTGYTPTDVTILNGSHVVTVPINQFLDSWSVLDFMAIVSTP
jgi:subtilisin-like proprotein convertase family protein/uncharacterized protein YvpB